MGVDSNDKENDEAIVMLSSDRLEKLQDSKKAHAEQEKAFGDVFGGIGMTDAQLAHHDELEELPQVLQKKNQNVKFIITNFNLAPSVKFHPFGQAAGPKGFWGRIIAKAAI